MRRFTPVITAIVVACMALGVSSALAMNRGGGSSGGGAGGSSSTSTTTNSATFFGTTVLAGSQVSTVSTGVANLGLTNVKVSSASSTCTTVKNGGPGYFTWNSCKTSVQATGTMRAGSDTTGLTVSMSYTDDSDWTITVARNAAGTSYTKPANAPFDLNAITGTITMSGGTATTSLSASGVTYGGTSYTASVSLASTGLQAVITLDPSVSVNGTTIGAVTLTLSDASGSSPQAALTFKNTTVPLPLPTFSFTSAGNWSATVTRGAAGSGASASLTGTITAKGGTVTDTLEFQGVNVSGTTLTADATISASGVQGSVTVTNLTLLSSTRTAPDGSAAPDKTNQGGGANLPGLGSNIGSANDSKPSIVITTGTATFSSTSPQTSISGTADFSGDTLQMTAQYTDSDDWTVSIAMNSAGAGYQVPANTTEISLQSLSGTITSTGGTLSCSLTVSGASVGNSTFNMSATITSSGFQASATVSNLVIGGYQLQNAAVSMSTYSPSASISGSLVTDAGTFDASISASGSASTSYTLSVSVEGADLANGSPDFSIQSLGFGFTVTSKQNGCAAPSTLIDVNGQVTIKNNTVALIGPGVFSADDPGTQIGFGCPSGSSTVTLTSFELEVEVAHRATYTKSLIVDLTIAWIDGTQSSWTMTFGGTFGTFKGPTYNNIKQGFFGVVDLSSQRDFSRDDFKRTVTLGVGFGVAAFQATGDTEWTTAITAMGFFSADRVSGDIGCTFQATPGTDFACSGDMRVNPPNYGIWHEQWGDM